MAEQRPVPQETVGDSVGVVLAGGCVLVDHVVVSEESKSRAWIAKHTHRIGGAGESDEQVHVLPLLTALECQDLIAQADESLGWGSRKHDRYPTHDLPVMSLGMYVVTTQPLP